MPLRKTRPSELVSLHETLCWVAHDVFNIEDVSSYAAVSLKAQMLDEPEELEMWSLSAAPTEAKAAEQIITAIRSGEIITEGRFSGRRITPAHEDWRAQEWECHPPEWISIPASAFDEVAAGNAILEFQGNTLRTRSGEYVEIRLKRADVLQLWPELEQANTADVEPIARPRKSRAGAPRKYPELWSDVDALLEEWLHSDGTKAFAKLADIRNRLKEHLGVLVFDRVPPSTIDSHIKTFLALRRHRAAETSSVPF
jgi:hypothetical protein